MDNTQIETLKAFTRKIIRTRCFGHEEDGGTIQDEAVAVGILEPFTVTQEHLDSRFVDPYEFEVGDRAYRLADWVETQALEETK